jgi:hypothetical protein
MDRKGDAAVGHPNGIISLDSLKGSQKTIIPQESLTPGLQHSIPDFFFTGTFEGPPSKNPPLSANGEGPSHGYKGIEQDGCNQGQGKRDRQGGS